MRRTIAAADGLSAGSLTQHSSMICQVVSEIRSCWSEDRNGLTPLRTRIMICPCDLAFKVANGISSVKIC